MGYPLNLPGQEKDWLGPQDETKHTTFTGQSLDRELTWFFTDKGMVLDPDYSEFSVRIHDPNIRSLSFVYRTLAILPKSRLREIHKLIGRYLDAQDNCKT